MPESRARSSLIDGGRPRFAEPVCVTRPNLPPLDALQDALRRIFESKWLTNQGIYHDRLEKSLAEFLEVDDCVLFCNGTLALQALAACLALSGEVITTSFTFPATIHSLSLAGLTPVFADIETDFYTLDPVRAAGAAGAGTSAILAVHVYGNPCDIPGLESVAREKNLVLYFDAAHALGARFEGTKIGRFGRAESFSFHATKIFNTFEGGAVASSDAGLCRELRLFRNFGIADEEHVLSVGTNAKMSEIHAAAGALAIPGLPDIVRRSRGLWERYHDYLSGIAGMVLPRERPGSEINGQYFPVEIHEKSFGLDRNEVHLALKADQILSRKYFHPACHTLPAYKGLPSARPENLPRTERAARTILCLPIYASMPPEYPEIISGIIRSLQENAERVRTALANRCGGETP